MMAWLPILLPTLAALLAFSLGEKRHAARSTVTIAIAVGASVVVGLLAASAFEGETASASVEMMPGLPLRVEADLLGLLFAAVATSLWAVTVIYASGYLKHTRNRGRFFGFFALCIASTNGVALAADPLTFLIFYETLSLATYPLVVHTGTSEALATGRRYLVYALGGGIAMLVATAWLISVAGSVEFTPGGALGTVDTGQRLALQSIFGLFVLGLGVKSALVPLHGWLPAAMVAPAPVSALLHAVAVVKAGAFGIIRLVNELYGPELATSLGVAQPLAVVAAITIVFGSVVALRQDDLKRRLAYSTIAQLSYITLGTALCTPLAAAGAVAHLALHAIMKITMFFTAGSLHETLKIKKVSALDGVARRMPLTMGSFALAALGLAGIPPLAGFYSKWLLGVGAATDDVWATFVFAASGAFTMGYMLPILLRSIRQSDHDPREGVESDPRLLWPILMVAAGVLVFGLTAGTDYGPVGWAIQAIAPSFGGLRP